MKVKDFIVLLNSLKYTDELFMYDNDDEVWQGYINEKQVYKYLEDMVVREMWVGTDGLCIKIC